MYTVTCLIVRNGCLLSTGDGCRFGGGSEFGDSVSEFEEVDCRVVLFDSS